MRDVLVTLLILGSIPFIFRRPQVGVMVYVWIGVMNPHRLAYGFAYDTNFAAIIAGVTVLSALIGKDLRLPPANTLNLVLFLFTAWTGVTSTFALYPEESFDFWVKFVKTMFMVFLIPALFHKKEDVRKLLWVIVLSIAYYGAKGGVWILLTGGQERVLGPERSYITDNNSLAVAVIMIIPLMRYLQLTSPLRYVRRGIGVAMVFCGVAVLGSYSRGALLAVAAMGAFLWRKSRQRLPLLLFAIILVPPLVAFMPDKWFERMDTISSYEKDASANARLNSWTTMVNIANDRPIYGGGFMIARPEVYQRYSPVPDIESHSAHSIYFQVLGEHGYVGLALYLLLLHAAWRKAGWIMRAAKDRADLAWARDLSAMMQVTLVGFAVGGAFLSLVNYDVPYYLIALLSVTLTLVEKELKTQAPAPAAAPAPSAAFVRNRLPRPGSR